jgi:DNA-binding NarL/FixJ family response regulator
MNRHPTRLHPSAESELISTKLVPPVPRAGFIARARPPPAAQPDAGLGLPPAGRAAGPLSEWEQAVLRLLPTRLSTREIGNELHVSVNTVRSQVQAIYSQA